MAAETASGSIENLFFPLYDKYFTLAEIQGLLDIYETEIGKKSIEVLLSLNKNLCKLDKLGDSTRAKDCAAYENGLKRNRDRLAKLDILGHTAPNQRAHPRSNCGMTAS